MKLVAISDSITNRKGKNLNLESQYKENELTQMIMAVLLFIMDKTLDENEECEIKHISDFLKTYNMTYLHKNLNNEDSRILANYIVRDILQNKGEKNGYNILKIDNHVISDYSVKLVADKLIDSGGINTVIFILTNQGYDFLFRTLEVDDEIKLSIEQRKLLMFISRGNYSRAVMQSAKIVSLVRQRRNDIMLYVNKIRENALNSSALEYESVIKGIFEEIKNNLEEIKSIQIKVELIKKKVNEDINQAIEMEDKLYQVLSQVGQIEMNLGTSIDELINLHNDKSNLSSLYRDVRKEMFNITTLKRFSFENDILKRFEENENNVNPREMFTKIVKPLLLPTVSRKITLNKILSEQSILTEREEEDDLTVDDYELQESKNDIAVKVMQVKYKKIIEVFLEYCMSNNNFLLSEFLEWFKNSDEENYLELSIERDIYAVMLELYSYKNMNVAAYYEKGFEEELVLPSLDFDLDVTMSLLKLEKKNFPKVNSIAISKTDAIFSVSIKKELMKLDIEMTDLRFEVI